MKKITLFLFLILIRQIVFAQKNEPGYAGVYLTKENFINNRISYKINTGNKGYKLEFPPIADWALEIRSVTPDSVHKFKPGTVYGYYDNGKIYRYAPDDDQYVPEDYYKIVDDKGLIIYTSEFNGGSEHYYSVDLGSPIRRLNYKNLKEDFKTRPEFVSSIKRLNDREVPGDMAKLDDQGNFIVNKIYRETIVK